jgi:hypothetical protein
MQKKLLILVLATLVLIGGTVLIWSKKSRIGNQSKIENLQTVQAEKVLSEKEKADKYAWNWDGDTSNWKVYMNDDFGFALRYPEEVFNFRIMPVSNGVGVYSEPLPLKEFRVDLTQKGYSEDNYTHKLWLGLNSLKTEQEYRIEAQKDTVTAPVSFRSKVGNIYGTKESISKMKSDYELFIKSGRCVPETFTVVFDDVENPNGDVRSYLHVGCEGNDMGRIYRAVYQSIRFF